MGLRTQLWMAATVTAAVLSASPAVQAQSATPQEQEAEALFEEAAKLAGEGKYAEACPKLERSQSLDPGMGTRFNLADCYEHTGRLRMALSNFREVEQTARESGKMPRAKEAAARAEAVDRRIPRLRLRVAAGAQPAVRIDGKDVEPSAWGEQSLDPGAHLVEASAPGAAPWSKKIQLAEGTRMELEVDLAPANGAAPAAAATPATGGARTAAPSGEPAGAPGSTQRTLGLAIGGLGAVGVAVGSIFGITAISRHNSARDQCGDPKKCETQQGADAWTKATTAGNISTVGFIAGGVLLAGGAALWLTAPRSDTRVGLGPGRVEAEVRW